jgi:glycosyltransferase 2 family protein
MRLRRACGVWALAPRPLAEEWTPRPEVREAAAVAQKDAKTPSKPDVHRSWNLALLLPAEPGRRNRRVAEAAFLILASLVTGLAATVARLAPDVDGEVAEGFAAVLGWAPNFWRSVFVCALAFALVIVGDVLRRNRWLLARDLLVAVLLVVAVGAVLGRLVDSAWLQADFHLFSNWGFPEFRLAGAVAIFAVASPELVRPARLLSIWLVGAAALGAAVLGTGLPSHVLGAVALGLGASALVRLAFGSAAGVPPTARVRDALTSLGVAVDALRISEHQRIGAAEYVGDSVDRSPLKVRVLGRDAQDAKRLARRWQRLAYRDPPRSAPVGRLEQVEHEAVATLMAARAGVRVPDVVTVGLGPEDDAILVTRQPDIAPLEAWSAEEVSDETLEELCRQVARLHDAGISHGRLNASNVLPTDEGPMLVDFSAATLGAPQSMLDIDVAELLVACTVLVGPERALAKAVDAGWQDSIVRVLPYLQRAALTPHLRDLARTHEVGLNKLRTAAAQVAGTQAPEITPLRRIRLKDLGLMAAVIFAAYLLITQLADIGFGTIADELRDADIAWVVVALVLAQATFIPSGVSVRGGVATPLPLLPCIVLQSALKFINLTVPSSAGRVATNLRCLQRMGAPRAEAIAGGTIDDVSNTVVQASLFLLVLPFVSVDIDTSQFKVAGPDRRLLIAIALALVVSLVLVLALPKVRSRVVPGVRDAVHGVWSVARVRRKRLEVFGGSVASELLYAVALGATCLAYGVHLNLGQLIFVNTSASVLSGLVPVPGGIGAAEAALSAGLITMGVDESTAFAIAVTQRLCTFYLPPIWGYFSLRWLGQRGYV